MGGCVASRELKFSHPRIVLVLGLDGAGSTTILYQLVLRKRLQTIPTLGVNHERVAFDGIQLECWDMGGMDKIRPLWLQYSREANGVMFVVDAADRTRWNYAANELSKLFATSGGRSSVGANVPLLIFANKQDLPNAGTVQEIEDALKLSSLPAKNVKSYACSAHDRDSLLEGVKWLIDSMKAQAAHSVGRG